MCNRSNLISLHSAHDTNITPIVFALGLLVPKNPLPLEYIPWGNPYSTSNIVPMGGHLTLERLSCNATAISPEGTYVRVVLNEAVVPFDSCQSGPGYSCALDDYESMLKRSLPDFITTCGIPWDYPQYLKFFWEWNATTTYNYQSGPIPYQDAETTV
jgi:acid phosphatase